MTEWGSLALIRITGWLSNLCCPLPQHWLRHWTKDKVPAGAPSCFWELPVHPFEKQMLPHEVVVEHHYIQ